MRSTRLRFPALPLVPFGFVTAGFLATRVVDFLRGVTGLEAVEGTEELPMVPEVFAFSRILAMRSETARAVGRSTPAAGVISLGRRLRSHVGGTYAISRLSQRTLG